MQLTSSHDYESGGITFELVISREELASINLSPFDRALEFDITHDTEASIADVLLLLERYCFRIEQARERRKQDEWEKPNNVGS